MSRIIIEYACQIKCTYDDVFKNISPVSLLQLHLKSTAKASSVFSDGTGILEDITLS